MNNVELWVIWENPCHIKNIWRGPIPKKSGFSYGRSVMAALIQQMFLSKKPLGLFLPQASVFFAKLPSLQWDHYACISLVWFCTITLGENFIMLQLSNGLPKWSRHSLEYTSHWSSSQEWESDLVDLHYRSLLLAHMDRTESSYLWR